MPTRFQDRGETLAGFAGRALVRCPRCARRAEVTRRPPDPADPADRADPAARARLVCPACGYVAETDGTVQRLGGPVDPYFGRPLWLQVPCAAHVLWAYNADHLAFLERYVTADLRTGLPPGPSPTGARNASLASRLPGWMKRGQDRAAIARGLETLRKMLDDA